MHFDTDPHRLFNGEGEPVPIHCVGPDGLDAVLAELGEPALRWAAASGFTAKAGQYLAVPDGEGGVAAILFGLGMDGEPLAHAKLARQLPKGTYWFAGERDAVHDQLAWGLGGYAFRRYKGSGKAGARLAGPLDGEACHRIEGATIARDLINTPANDLGPAALEYALRKIATHHGAEVSSIIGDDLLAQNFPMVHTVGRASSDAPRVVDFSWGAPDAPKVTLVGKGVTFDTGGLNIKPGSSMALMKKDMGGAANVAGLAHMIMAANLPVRLRVIVAAVENAISGSAFRPGDVLPSRKGLTVEIGNTDAEGRLILADCLALADEETPDLLIDMATLTGAARVALGPDLPPFYTHDDTFAVSLSDAAAKAHDPLWRMPLWAPYQEMLASQIADVNHITKNGFAGSVTAALFLSRFVERARCWAHFDIFGWVPTEKPWAPVGGEAQGIHALFLHLKDAYSA